MRTSSSHTIYKIETKIKTKQKINRQLDQILSDDEKSACNEYYLNIYVYNVGNAI